MLEEMQGAGGGVGCWNKCRVLEEVQGPGGGAGCCRVLEQVQGSGKSARCWTWLLEEVLEKGMDWV